jgi:hypothetical protein
MPDISKCSNSECSLSEFCYRFTCKPDPYYQSYSDFSQEEDGNCQYFLELHKPVLSKITDEDAYYKALLDWKVSVKIGKR